MKRNVIAVFSAGLSLWISPSPVSALMSTSADVIFLKQSCGGLADCTSDVQEILDWVNARMKPGAYDYSGRNKEAPAEVSIGPGLFVIPQGQPLCDGGASVVRNVSFRGSGRGNTVLTGGLVNFGAVHVQACDNLSFQDMTMRADSRRGVNTGSVAAATWGPDAPNTGVRFVSFWSNIDLEGSTVGWYDQGGLHFWFNSRIGIATTAARALATGSGATATTPYYTTGGGESRFYASELLAEHDAGGSDVATVTGTFISGGASAHLVGSAVRVLAKPNSALIAADFGGLAALYGSVTMHGGIVSVDASQGAVQQAVFGAKVPGGDGVSIGVFRLEETVFSLIPATGGLMTRLAKLAPSGVITAPMQWPAAALPPASTVNPSGTPLVYSHLNSEEGQDMYVESDCPINPGLPCAETPAPADRFPHLMIYTETCTGQTTGTGPWFDTFTNRCRGL